MSHSFSLTARTITACAVAAVLSLAIHSLCVSVFGLAGAGAYLAAGLAGLALAAGAGALLTGPPASELRALSEAGARVAAGDFKAAIPDCSAPEAYATAQAMASLVGQLKLTLGNWKGLTEAVLIPYALVDLKGNLTFCSKPCLDMLERDGKPSDYIGMFFSEFFYGDPTRKALIVEIMENNKGVVRDVEFKNIKGNTRFIQAALSPLHDLDGKVSGGMCMYLDYTEVRLKEDQIVAQGQSIMNAVRVVEDIVRALSDTSGMLSSQVDGASRGAAQQSRRAEETATAMEEMNATVLEVARNAGSAAERAGQAQAKAQEGAGVVEKAVGAIHEVDAITARLKASMAGLSEQAGAIGRIMGVISDIADQTNLLALNAAIEAARAGEAGRGFAVVADEVRKLAEKTMVATKEVGEVIGAIQKGVGDSAGEAEQAAKAVERATDLAGRSGRSLGEIVGLVVQTSDQVRSIAAAAEQQSAASDEIARAVEDVRRVSAETAREMSGAAGGVDSLSKLAGELRNAVRALGS